MLIRLVITVSLLLGASAALAQQSERADEAVTAQDSDAAQLTAQVQDTERATDTDDVSAQEPGAPKTLAGMSILGNEEAPKSLVIVPWKSSEIGDGLGVTDTIDERARPVDKEVFLREVHYYELRTGAGG